MTIIESIQEAEQVALSKLGAIIEVLGTELKPEDASKLREEAARLLDVVEHTQILHNPDILISLRLLAIPIVSGKGNNWPGEFMQRLSQVFPLKSVNALTLRTIKFAAMANQFDLQLAPTPMEMTDHMRRREGKLTKTIEQRPHIPALRAPGVNRGTDTELVPCPECGLEKRCDQKTKNFRCRCGFASMYPFPAVS